jgi:hypothetical protein
MLRATRRSAALDSLDLGSRPSGKMRTPPGPRPAGSPLSFNQTTNQPSEFEPTSMPSRYGLWISCPTRPSPVCQARQDTCPIAALTQPEGAAKVSYRCRTTDTFYQRLSGLVIEGLPLTSSNRAPNGASCGSPLLFCGCAFCCDCAALRRFGGGDVAVDHARPE